MNPAFRKVTGQLVLRQAIGCLPGQASEFYAQAD